MTDATLCQSRLQYISQQKRTKNLSSERGGPYGLLNENQVDGDSKSTNERDPSLDYSLGSRHADTRDFYPALAALVSPVLNIFFLTVHWFN